jgi:hypothetical protein
MFLGRRTPIPQRSGKGIPFLGVKGMRCQIMTPD